MSVATLDFAVMLPMDLATCFKIFLSESPSAMSPSVTSFTYLFLSEIGGWEVKSDDR